LTELLVTMTVIAALASLTVPAWRALHRAGSSKAATSLVMDSLERARGEAITKKRDVWLLFRHSVGSGCDSLRIVSRGEEGYVPLGAWVTLPAGITFHDEPGTLMDERPAGDLLAAACKNADPSEKEVFGSVMFRRSGGIGIPAQGGNRLCIGMGSRSKGAVTTINLARASGRADTAASP
jgi:hypothetical protein